MLKNISFIVLLSFFLSGCLKGPGTTEMCNYEPCQAKATANEIQAVQTYLSNNNIQAEQHCSGLFYKIENPGTGKTANVCDYIAINYIGRLTNGNVFDQNTDPANPAVFQLGSLITAWKSGIPLIKEGGRILLYVSPSLAYGNQDVRDQNNAVIIPGGSILVFEINFLQIK